MNNSMLEQEIQAVRKEARDAHIRLWECMSALRPIVGLLRHGDQGMHDKLFDELDALLEAMPESYRRDHA